VNVAGEDTRQLGTSDDAAIARAWLDAVNSPVIKAELESIYAEVAREIASRGPSCWASGRCCNFAKTGHLLYVTGLEAAYTVARRNELEREVASDARGTRPPQPLPQLHPPQGALSLTQIDAAKARGDCPFLEGNLCGAHTIKPLGCRVYFCDASAQDWQHELTERALERIRALHDRHGLSYRYGEWRAMLAWVVSDEAMKR
jgi:Fe-S-cluster containining protein